MRVIMDRAEINKMIRKHIPYVMRIGWKGEDAELEIDEFQLKPETVRGQKILRIDGNIKMKKGNYVICPIIRKDKEVHYIVLQ